MPTFATLRFICHHKTSTFKVKILTYQKCFALMVLYISTGHLSVNCFYHHCSNRLMRIVGRNHQASSISYKCFGFNPRAWSPPKNKFANVPLKAKSVWQTSPGMVKKCFCHVKPSGKQRWFSMHSKFFLICFIISAGWLPIKRKIVAKKKIEYAMSRRNHKRYIHQNIIWCNLYCFGI